MFKKRKKLNNEVKPQEKEEAVVSAPVVVDEKTAKALEIENKNKEDAEKARLDEAEQKVSKRSQKKKKLMSLLFFFLNIGVVAGLLTYQLIQEPFVSLEGLGINVGMIFVLILVFVLSSFFEVLRMSYLVKKDTGRYRFAISFKTLFVGKYYDSITPLSVGGEPAQVAYLKSHEVSTSASLSIPVANMVFQQLAFFVLSVIALIVSSVDSSFGSFASITSIIGFVFSFSYLGFIIFLSVSKNFGRKLVVKVLKFLQKIKIIKNYEKVYQKVSKIVEDYQVILSSYMKNPKDFFVMFSISFIRSIFNYSLPFVIYCCFFPGASFDLYFRFFVCGVLIDLASSFFPLPGGTGMNELTFGALFGTFFSGGRLFWAIIFWRLATYYVFIITGIIILSYDVSYGNRKYKWQKKQRELEAESLAFKQVQIQNFRKDRAKRRKKEMKSE